MKRAFVYPALITIGILMILPLAWMFSSSFKTTAEIFEYPPRLVPRVLRLVNYAELFLTTGYPRWFLNSTIITVCSLALSLFFCSLAGFAFAKYDFRLRGLLFAILLASMTIPFHVILIPLYVLMARLGWANTYNALIVPYAITAFGVFLMRQYMVSLPDELLDAARVDGASEFRIYWQIILPLARPALAVMAIVGTLGSWNAFLWPMIILSTPEKFTLPIGLSVLLGEHLFDEGQWGRVMAGSFLSVLPILVMFALMQKQFISGLTLGSVRK